MDAGSRALIDRAAETLGQTRTEFMLASARERATDVLLGQSLFVLTGSDWANFTSALDHPPEANEDLRALLSRKALWHDNPAKAAKRRAG